MRFSTIITLSACTVASIFPTSCFAESESVVEERPTTFTKDGRTFTTRYVDLEKDPDAPIRTSGTVEPSLEEQAVLNKAHIDWMQSKENGIFSFDPVSNKKIIPTIIHIVKPFEDSTANEAEGKEQNQIDVLNSAFEDNEMGFFFDLIKIETHISQDYWNEGTENYPRKDNMVKETREGGMETLNMWFVAMNQGLLGYAVFPSDTFNDKDGVVNLHSAIKGGSDGIYNLGATAVHEVGHWLGLYHTFQNGCSDTGDFVPDTPAERDPNFGCQAPGDEPDTCPSDPGKDPIHNYMDYSDDVCMYEFTSEQALRANSQWDSFRAVNTESSFPTQTLPPQQTFSPTPEIHCINSPYKAKMSMEKGSKILLSCEAIDVSLDPVQTNCKRDGKLATHCPLSCGTCDREMHADSKATFLYDAVTGKIKNCRWLQRLSNEKRAKLCANNESLKMTCRVSCNYFPTTNIFPNTRDPLH